MRRRLLSLLLALTIVLLGGTQSLAVHSFRIAYSVWKEDGGTQIFVMNDDGSNARQLTDHFSMNGDPAWSPDSKKIIFATDRHGKMETYAVSLNNGVLTNLTNTPDLHERGAVFSPDGNRIAFSGDAFIYIADADFTNRKQLSNEDPFLAQDSDPRWSPDGTRIAFTSHRDGNNEIYVMDANGKNHVNLSKNPAYDRGPSWSPDGKFIVFSSDRLAPVQNFEIFRLNIESGRVKQLTDSPGWDIDPCWSPDGERIIFTSSRDGKQFGIYVMDASGGDEIRLTETPWDERFPVWSPIPVAVNPAGKMAIRWGKIRSDGL